MRRIACFLALCLAATPAGAQSVSTEAGDGPVPDGERPVLVELFTSQGCPLCPDANRYLGELDERDDVFALAYAVSYWDMYGWTDTYARPEYVQRQRTYLPRLGVNRLYTPHFVVDGAADAPGWDRDHVSDAVAARLENMPQGPRIEVSGGTFGSFTVRVSGEAPEPGLDVWLVAYAPGWATVEIGAGENEGLEMPHYNMVKSLTYLGMWSGGDVEFTGQSFRRYGAAIILQGANGGPVYGLAQADPTGQQN